MKVIIMRGLPGSGKSAFADKLTKQAENKRQRVVIASADFSHMVGGVYKFDPAKKASAHNDCLSLALRSMGGHGPVKPDLLIIDNTNCSAWEIAPFYRLAEMFGHEVEIIRLHCDFETACKRNVHEVPTAAIWEMWRTIMTEKLPPWWKETILLGDSTELT